MANKLTRGQVNDLIAGFATKDPAYRRALLASPRDVLAAQLGVPVPVPASVEVVVIEERPGTFHVVIPSATREGEALSDADLELVSGGYKGLFGATF